MEKLTNIIEAILFAAGDAVPIDLLREKLEVTKRDVDEAIRQLEKKYTGACGIRLLQFNHKLQLATNPDYKELVATTLMPIREKEFTKTILECAAIIAYKQPITRGELENIRGMSSDYAVTTLLSLDMIAPCGRKDSPGRPILYETTDNFLKRFKLKSLSELPDYEELMQKIAELNAIEEISSNYLYEKDVYDPDSDPELIAENGKTDVEEKTDDLSAGGFELPDFLDDIKDGIIKIQ
ncbi:MAG: SMC-Scp complex subunit ScpB [Clostridia bacterium]|nr:SMC-Scp complex subunit ScpB [Clostridia bacterium]